MAQPTPDTPTITHRAVIEKLSPWWLRGFIALRLLYAIAVHIDAVAEQVLQGVRRRFPGLDAGDSLGILGRERRIRRGRAEPDATYASRLLRWLDDHARRGGPYALLAQLAAHYAAAPFDIDLLYYSTQGYFMPAGDEVTRALLPAFVPDADTTKPGRWWLFYHWPTAIPDDDTWDDAGTWDDGGVWDSSLSPEEVADLRLVPSEWGNGHSRGTLVLLAPGDVPEDFTTAGDMIRIEF